MKSLPFLRTLVFDVTLILTSKLHADEIGLPVGEQATAFQLTNQDGTEISLAKLTAEHDKVALVFYRSADWCPYCKRQLMGLQENLKTLESAGITLVGISYDSVKVLERFSKEQNIGYTLLSDPGSKTIDAYQVRNKKVRTGRAEGIPHPTIFLVNKKGIIAGKLREKSYRDRRFKINGVQGIELEVVLFRQSSPECCPNISVRAGDTNTFFRIHFLE